jgi:hypothetical protein
MDQDVAPQADQQTKWRALSSIQRRIAGVLVEKAKTTPDAYPMTLNALTTGCNQKSNRDPQMELKGEDVEQALEELRAMGVVTEVQGSGRVSKFRHNLYDWLGVDKVEIAVMAELLLRGEQTVGELRGRAARMEPIADLNTLRPILQSLVEKRLVVELTPEGRGQVVSHALYKEREMNELRARHSGAVPSSDAQSPAPLSFASARSPASNSTSHSPPSVTPDMLAELRVEVAELRAEVGRLRAQVRELEEKSA